MNGRYLRTLAIAGIAALAACSSGGMNQMLPSNGSGAAPATFPVGAARLPQHYRAVCDRVQLGDWARCFALVRTDVGGIPGGFHGLMEAHATPAGYGPAQLDAAYSLNTSGGGGQTVALVEVGDYPTAAADLAVYRSQYGLPACGTGCFEKVSQTGSTTKLPRKNAGWAEESALDMDMVSATCPNCHIIMVEASSASNNNLNAAENEAAALHATVISNSFGGSETSASNSAYNHAGIVILASAGDNGYAEGSQQPCSYQTVVCTGGSSLVMSGNTRVSETVWNDLASGNGATGSGCSSKVAKPSWQTDRGCTKRSQSDVSFDADPQNGVAIYDSTAYQGYSGWLEFGGTSVAAPALAGVYALAGNGASLGPNAAKVFWTDAGSGLYSVTSGNNLAAGGKCGAAYAYICTAGTGTDGVYSGPAGWGTPNGTTDF